MKKVKYLLFIIGVLITIYSCGEGDLVEFEPTNSTITTRFINSDSVSVINIIVDSLNTELNFFDSINQITSSQISALNIRINSEPDNDSIDIFRELVLELELVRTNLSDTILGIRAENTLLGNKRDSLNNGFSFLNQITNLDNNQVDVLDTLITDYQLPLPFNEQNVNYEISITGSQFRFNAAYFLKESIDVNGVVSLSVEEVSISLPMDEITFDSTSIEDENFIIFYY